MIISVNGALGFLRSNNIMLHFFAWILIFLFFILFIGGILIWIWSKTLKKFSKFIFLQSILNYDHQSRWALSHLVDFTQSTLQCCGSKNFTDWGRPDNRFHQLNCQISNITQIEAEETPNDNEVRRRKRRRTQTSAFEIDISKPEVRPETPERPKYSNRKLPTSGFDIPPINQFQKPRRLGSPEVAPPLTTTTTTTKTTSMTYMYTTLPMEAPSVTQVYQLTLKPTLKPISNTTPKTIRSKNLFNDESFLNPDYAVNDNSDMSIHNQEYNDEYSNDYNQIQDGYYYHNDNGYEYTEYEDTEAVDNMNNEWARNLNGQHCLSIPESCCNGGGFNICGSTRQEAPYVTGCVDRVSKFFVNSTATIAGIWILLWLIMIAQVLYSIYNLILI